MGDIEWYLESQGSRSGPYKAAQVVDMFERGLVSAQIHCTSDKLVGEYVVLSDLVEAYYELKSSSEKRTQSVSSTSEKTKVNATDDSFVPPSMPTEQIEASKFIVLQAKESNPNAESGESLLNLLKSQRERRVQGALTGGQKSSPTGAPESEGFGTLARSQRIIPPQAIVILAVLAIILITYQTLKTVESRKNEITDVSPSVLPVETTPVSGSLPTEKESLSTAPTAPPTRVPPLSSPAQNSYVSPSLQDTLPDTNQQPPVYSNEPENPPAVSQEEQLYDAYGNPVMVDRKAIKQEGESNGSPRGEGEDSGPGTEPMD